MVELLLLQALPMCLLRVAKIVSSFCVTFFHPPNVDAEAHVNCFYFLHFDVLFISGFESLYNAVLLQLLYFKSQMLVELLGLQALPMCLLRVTKIVRILEIKYVFRIYFLPPNVDAEAHINCFFISYISAHFLFRIQRIL